MNISSLKHSPVSARNFTEKKLARYFSTTLLTFRMKVALGLIGLGILLFVGKIIFGSSVLLGLIGLLLLISGGLDAYSELRLSKPTDQEYDAWVERQAAAMRERALARLFLDESQVEGQPLLLRSFVLPGSRDAEKYGMDGVLTKRGKDYVSRFSVNVYTYFFPVEDHIAIFTSDVNALNHSLHFDEIHQYFYYQIAGIVRHDAQDTINSIKVAIQRCSLRIANGDKIEIGSTINITTFYGAENNPGITFPETSVDKTLVAVFKLIQDRNRPR